MRFFFIKVKSPNLKQCIRRALGGKHPDYPNALASMFELMAAK